MNEYEIWFENDTEHGLESFRTYAMADDPEEAARIALGTVSDCGWTGFSIYDEGDALVSIGGASGASIVRVTDEDTGAYEELSIIERDPTKPTRR